jgi:glutathione synthase/RimK-type ligase-like ATP-grasp enzyme
LVSSEDDKETFLNFARNHKKFIVKPYNSSGGRGVCIKNMEETDPEECFNEFISQGGAVVCEELIEQSQKMSVFHPSSVNTLRLPTIRINDEVFLFHPFFRTGVGNAVVDNALSGGNFALVDPETGMVFSDARNEKGDKFQTHPDTGLSYKGYQLPDWDQAVELVKELSAVLKDCRYVGWDLAHTENGWVMVEGNPRGQLVVMQMFFKTGFRKELDAYIEAAN